jgi:hypothetical protein
VLAARALAARRLGARPRRAAVLEAEDLVVERGGEHPVGVVQRGHLLEQGVRRRGAVLVRRLGEPLRMEERELLGHGVALGAPGGPGAHRGEPRGEIVGRRP